MNRINLRLIVAVLVVMVLPFAVGAENDPDPDPAVQRDWKLRFGFVVVDTNGGVTASTAPGDVHVGFSIGTGGGGSVSLERRISPLVGIEFGVSGVVLDMGFRTEAGIGGVSTSTETVFFTPITVGLNFHVVPEGPVDVYIGPVFALASYRTISVRTGVDFCWWWECGSTGGWTTEVRWQSDSEPTWGARLGAGFSFGSGRWSLETSLMYMDSDYQFWNNSDDTVTSIDINPLMFSMAAGFKF